MRKLREAGRRGERPRPGKLGKDGRTRRGGRLCARGPGRGGVGREKNGAGEKTREKGRRGNGEKGAWPTEGGGEQEKAGTGRAAAGLRAGDFLCRLAILNINAHAEGCPGYGVMV